MAEAPYMHQNFPRWIYFADGMTLVVQSAEEAAKYDDCGDNPDGPFTGVVEQPAEVPVLEAPGA